MSYVFRAVPSELMAAVLRDLERARQGADAETFERAMVSLVGIYVRSHADPATAPSDDEFGAFRVRTEELLAPLRNQLHYFVIVTSFAAEGAQEPGDRYNVYLRRSAIQLLLDDFARTSAEGLLDKAEVTELDEELRRIGQEHGPLPEDWIPAGVPDHHWWWRYPSGANAGTAGAAAVAG